MAAERGEKVQPNADALMRLAIADAVEDCWDVDCEECQVSAPVPCTEHLDLDEMIEQASLAALDILAHVRAADLGRTEASDGR
jgi:hypothetical protein